jgi:DNA-binding MarR family transcriptional regulator
MDRKKLLDEEYTGNWVWRAVAALVSFSDSSLTISRMAQGLDVDISVIVEALEGLEEMGILRRTEGGYERVLKFVYYSDRHIEAKKLHGDHVLISTQILSRLDPNQKTGQAFFRTGFLATNREIAAKYLGRMESLLKEWILESDTTEKNELVALSLSAVDVTQGRFKKEGM